MKRLGMILFVAASFAACGSSAPAGSTMPDPAVGLSTEAPIGTLTGLEQGDVACYASISMDGGEAVPHMATFDLCPGNENDASAFIDQRITWTTAMLDVPADSCEGDPECTEHEKAPVIETITAAP